MPPAEAGWVSPIGQSRQAAALLGQTYEQAEERLMRLLARRAAAGLDTDYDQWARAKLAEAQAYLRAVREQTRRLAQVAEQLVREQLAAAMQAGSDAAGEAAAALLGQAVPVIVGDPRVVELLGQEVLGNLNAAHLGMLRQAGDVYALVQGMVAAGMATGTMTLPQAVQDALDRYAARGVGSFTDRAGRTWGLQEYAEMQVRTATARAYVNGAMDRWDRLGQQLVIVSDSPEECPLCRPWEGRVLSRSGEPQGGQRYPTVAEATAAGLFHPNCTHGLGLWVPGLSQPMRRNLANPEGYEDRQRERYLERRVRGWKRRGQVAVTPEAQARARAGLARARAAYEAHVDAANRLPQRWRLTAMRAGGAGRAARPAGVPSPYTPRRVLPHGAQARAELRRVANDNGFSADYQAGLVRAYDRVHGVLGDRLLLELGEEGTLDPGVLDSLVRLSWMDPELLGRVKRVHIGGGSVVDLDQMGDMRGVRPRGWGAGQTWDNVRGAQSNGTVVLGTRGLGGSVSMPAHEAGHAVAQALGLEDAAGWSAATRVHASAASKGLHRLYERVRDDLSPYFQQPGSAGFSEFLAEGVAMMSVRGNHAAASWGWGWVWQQIGPQFTELVMAAARAGG
jgi:hypothetical protein